MSGETDSKTTYRIEVTEKDVDKIFEKLDKLAEQSIKHGIAIESVCKKIDILSRCSDNYREDMIARFATQKAAIEGLDKDIGRVAAKTRAMNQFKSNVEKEIALLTIQQNKLLKTIATIGGAITLAIIGAIMNLIL